MAQFYLFIFLLLVAWQLVRVSWKPALILEYPYFIAAVFFCFILPQAVSLLQFSGGVSRDGVTDVMLMCCLCLGAAILGYRASPSFTILRRLSTPLDPDKMFHVGVVFILCAYFFSYLLIDSQKNLEENTSFTGIGTIYLFFASLIFPGFAICLILYLQWPTWMRFLAILAGGVIPAAYVINARREPIVLVGLTIILGLFYTRRRVPSRLVIFASLFFVTLAIPATGTYRGLAKHQGELDALRQLRLIQNFKDYFSKESILELRNAAALIESSARFSQYDYGAAYWNQIVFRFVPAQIVGMERKNSLMIGTTVQKMQSKQVSTGYELATGSTVTGMGDSFQHFGWFGCLFFAFLAFIFRSIWVASLQPNAMFAQLLYIMTCTSAMRAVTHQTTDFLPGLIYQFTFLSLGVFYAAKRDVPYRSRRGNAPKGIQ